MSSEAAQATVFSLAAKISQAVKAHKDSLKKGDVSPDLSDCSENSD